MSDIRVLFESGHHAKVGVTLYNAPADRARLLDAYVTTECEGAVTRSARRAAEAVLNWLPEKHRPSQPLVAGFDLSDLPSNYKITGESAGLAFSVALAEALTGQDIVPTATTGILTNSTATSAVSSVKGIIGKIEGILETLPKASQIILPESNLNELPDTLLAEIKAKKINLVPVTTLDKTLDDLFCPTSSDPKPQKPDHKKSLKYFWIGLIGIVAFLSVATFSFFNKPTDTPTENLLQKDISKEVVKTPAQIKTVSDGSITFSVADLASEAVAKRLTEMMAESFGESMIFSARVTVKKRESSDNMQTIEGTLTEVFFTDYGIENKLPDMTANIASEIKITNSSELLSQLLFEKITLEVSLIDTTAPLNNDTNKSISSGKGFD